MEVLILPAIVFGVAFLVAAFFGLRRMRANDEYRLGGGELHQTASFEQDKERAEVMEAARRISGGDLG